MTAAEAEAAVCGITDGQLAALRSGGWDDGGVDYPSWGREVNVGGERVRQRMFLHIFAYGPRWNADSGGEDIWRDSFDDVLAWCDERAGGGKSAEVGSATKQEDRFARTAAGFVFRPSGR